MFLKEYCFYDNKCSFIIANGSFTMDLPSRRAGSCLQCQKYILKSDKIFKSCAMCIAQQLKCTAVYWVYKLNQLEVPQVIKPVWSFKIILSTEITLANYHYIKLEVLPSSVPRQATNNAVNTKKILLPSWKHHLKYGLNLQYWSYAYFGIKTSSVSTTKTKYCKILKCYAWIMQKQN